jgi:hypothetical protein
MLSDREQRGPRWGVAESRVLTQSNRVEVRQFCSWAEQINQLQLPLGGIFLVEQTKWAWSASRSDRPDLTGEIPVQPFRLERQLSARQTAIRR